MEELSFRLFAPLRITWVLVLRLLIVDSFGGGWRCVFFLPLCFVVLLGVLTCLGCLLGFVHEWISEALILFRQIFSSLISICPWVLCWCSASLVTVGGDRMRSVTLVYRDLGGTVLGSCEGLVLSNGWFCDTFGLYINLLKVSSSEWMVPITLSDGVSSGCGSAFIFVLVEAMTVVVPLKFWLSSTVVLSLLAVHDDLLHSSQNSPFPI